MKRLLMVLIGLVVLSGTAWAQTVPRATSLHRWAWDQIDPVQIADLVYEVSMDGGPFSPILSVSCQTSNPTTAACTGALTVGLTAGRHSGVLRAFRVVDSIRIDGAETAAYAFDFVTAPPAPSNPRLEPPPAAGPSVLVYGTIRERYPFVGLDVARAWLDIGADFYLGAQQLSSPDYTVQPGDRVGLLLYRP